MARTSGQGNRRGSASRRLTVYGRFLQWVQFRYKLTQIELADVLDTTQGTVSNWQKGKHPASAAGNQRMADRLGFDSRLRDVHAKVLAYGQDKDMPQEEPENMPYGLADLVISDDDWERIQKVQREWEERHRPNRSEGDEPTD